MLFYKYFTMIIDVSHETRRLYDEWHWNTLLPIIDKSLGDRTNHARFYYYNGGDVGPKLVARLKQDTEPLAIVLTIDYHGFVHDDAQGLITFDEALAEMATIPRQFIVLTAMGNASMNHVLPPNVHMVHYGGDILIQQTDYLTLEPQREKNFSSQRWWCSLTHRPRVHRLLSAMILLGQDLGFDEGIDPPTGLLRIGSGELDSTDSWKDIWPDSTATPDQCKILDQGYQRLRENLHGGQPAGNVFQGLIGSDNAANFNRALKSLYKNSLVEIINNTIAHGYSIANNEKYINTVYGFNLPIMISSVGTMDYLRRHGWDLFDDVIDHGYDREPDTLQRIFQAIDLNRQLLTDRDHAQRCWNHCVPGMEKNLAWAQGPMYDYWARELERGFIECLARIG